MTSSTGQRANELFMQLAELPQAERAAALDEACGDNAALRAEVESLLRSHNEAGRFLASPTADGAAPDSERSALSAAVTMAAPIREGPGSRIGPYKLLQLIGEGGFGSVFMAEQEKPVQRKVALKIIKLGMDTKGVIARFEAERQALALMDHPNIARVLDAGATETGRPFFVMELCKGEAIVEYCDKHNVSIPERLELFAQVCAAVQHAHTKGIIHRDIKPSNVLVNTQDGRPHAKVIDFGIAKATASKLTEKTLFTEHRALIGTPEYMSPEQAEGSLDIDTRTDVYSLGVLLYELLTGTTPFSGKELRSAAYAEIQRIIREVEPPKPSTRLSHNTDTIASVAAHRHTEPKKLGTIVRGDLDWIVMKSLEKDRQRRYETANGLAMDIQRYLAGEAVLAAPPGAAYRMRKFVRRHRAQVVAAGLVTIALLLGLAGTAWQAKVASDRADAAKKAEADAKTARDAEKARADELYQVSEFQGEMLAQVDPATAGVRLTGDVNRRFAAALAKAKVPEAEWGDLANEFRQNWTRVNATDAATALIDDTILKPAVKAIDEQFKDQPVIDARLRQVLANRYANLGLYDSAYPLQRSALETRRRVLGQEHPETLNSVSNMGDLLQDQGKFTEAEPYLREALEKGRRIRGEDDSSTLKDIGNLGTLLFAQGKLAEAEPYYVEALEKKRRLLGEQHPSTVYAINFMGILRQAQGRKDEALKYYREALEKGRATHHPQTRSFLGNVGDELAAQGQFEEAERCVREALEMCRHERGEEHPDTLGAIDHMGRMLENAGKLDQAEPFIREALEKRRRVLGEEHPVTILSINHMGGLRLSQRRFAEAEVYYRDALEKSRRVLGIDHQTTLECINNLGAFFTEQDKHAEAEPFFREGLEIHRRLLGEQSPYTLSAYNEMGIALFKQGKNADAQAVFAEGLDACQRASSPEQTALLLHHHAEVLLKLGRFDDAVPGALRAAAMYREHPDWASHEASHALLVLADILKAQGKAEESLAAHRERLALKRKTTPRESEALSNSIAICAIPLLQRGTLETVKEAEALLRECLDIRLKTSPNSWAVPSTRSQLGGAILATAALDPALTAEARAVRLREAEPLLLDGYAGLKDNPAVPTPAQNNGADRRREALERVVHLYEVWAKTEPGKGYDAKAAAWSAKLNAAGISTGPETKP